LDARERRQVLVVELLVRGQVSADHAEQVVRVAEQALGLEHVRNLGHALLEPGDGLAIRVAHRDENQRLEAEAERRRVESRVVPGDRFWLVSFLLVLVPGADWAYVIAVGLRDRSIAPPVGGVLVGYVTLTAVVAASVATLVARSPALLTGLTVLGALYLLRLGVAAVAHPAVPEAGAKQEDQPWIRRAARGAGISGLNPKALLLFLALLPQFATRGGGWPIAAQIAVLGGVHAVNCAVVYLTVGLAARTVLRARPSMARVVTRPGP
jgi:threonine/homoserine/homoserine lactone efflux protein